MVLVLLGAVLVTNARATLDADDVTAAKPAVVHEHDVPRAPAAKKPATSTQKPGPTVVAELPETTVRSFSMLGVTWDPDARSADLAVDVRWRHDGRWSSWTSLDLELGPDVEGGRPGTEPQWTDASDGVAVRVTSTSGHKPSGLRVAMIDPGSTPDVRPVAATVAQPAIIMRSQWGASAGGTCSSPVYGATTLGAVIHHTAGSNTYTKSQSASIVKATQAYHINSRDWCDIGYNFLVDKYGQIFEGRKGGITKPVRAAHSGNDAVNQETMGVSMMGTFSTTAPTSAMKASVARLVAWRFDQYNRPAKGTYSLGGKTLNRIAGHRNVVSTECPGAKAYAWLSASGGLRDSVETLLAQGEVSTDPPANLTVTGHTSSSVSLSWSAVAGAPRYSVMVKEAAGVVDQWARFDTASGTVKGLKPGTTYWFRVRTLDASDQGLSAYSPAPGVSALTDFATAPTGLRVTGTTATTVTLAWNGLPGVPLYSVMVKDAAGVVDQWARFDTASGTVKGLQTGKAYTFRVRALDAKEQPLSGYSPEPGVSATPGGSTESVPTGLAVTGTTSTSVSLSWNPVSGAPRYSVMVKDAAGVVDQWARFDTASGTVKGLKPGTTYWFRVRTVDASNQGLSDYSPAPGVSAKTSAPAAPTGLTVTGTSSTSVSLSWNPVSGAPRYSVMVKDAAGVVDQWARFDTASGTVKGLKPGTTYWFRVRTLDASNQGLSDYSPAPGASAKTMASSAGKNSVTASSSMPVEGHGFGHGIGMGQYGAQGAATGGKSFSQILAFYYPGTTLEKTSKTTMRVLLSGATSSTLTVRAKSGLRFRIAGGSVVALPATQGGTAVTQWRVKPVDSNPAKSALQYYTGAWHTFTSVKFFEGDGQLENSEAPVEVKMGDGTWRPYRSRVRAAHTAAGSHGRRIVNHVTVDDYTRGVVPAEMPSSWKPEALKAQAVAARTYGVRSIRSSSYYDICDTTSCQVYRGASVETSSTNSAVSATAGQILTWEGKPAFTQFSSSSGGATAAGSQPYLTAHSDPYDDDVPNSHHSWTKTVSASTLQKAYPSIGTLVSMTVTDRTTLGRVEKLVLKGTKGSVTISGNTARSVMGLQSNWFSFG
jgi:SpoIID/LytB domain protein